MAVKPRHTAEERRAEILDAARFEFASRGLHGTSTEDIARRAGISQPYVFRLFGTKKELFLASCERCMQETLETMRDAAVGKTGEEALEAMGKGYMDMLADDPRRLMLQMHMYAASDDEDVCRVAREGYGRLVEFVEGASGLDTARVARFFAKGMLINVIAAMGLRDDTDGWAGRLVDGCKQPN
jgi:AcrR family transcriptional regulator